MKYEKVFRYRWVFIAVGIAILYWVFEGIIDAFLFFEANLWSELFHPPFHEIWMRSIIIIIILAFGIYFQYSINKLRESKNKIDDLYSLLLAIRNINQLIAQESDLEELLKKSAETLLETRGYIDTTLSILKEGVIVPVAHSGDHERKHWSVDPEGDGKIPSCVEEILEDKEEKVIQSTSKFCKKCDHCDHKGDHKTIVMPLIRGESTVGAIHTCLEKGREIREDEIDLLNEIADDLAHAREKILMEKEKGESERKRRFLNTLLRQDLMSKNQLAAGALQLLQDEVNLSGEDKNNLETALRNNLQAIDIIEEVGELEKINHVSELGKVDLIKKIEKAIEDNKGMIEREEVELEFDGEKEIFVKGDYSLSNLFHNLIRVRLDNDSSKIMISLREDEKVKVVWEDDGEKIPEKIRKNIIEGHYTGESTGIKGFRYYILGELVDHNEGIIEIGDSEMGGINCKIHLKRIQ